MSSSNQPKNQTNSQASNLLGNHSDKQPLKHSVVEAMTEYFKSLDGEKPAMVYDMVINEVESALLKSMMNYTQNNQSHAAEYLGLNRGTLRKKLKEHNLI